MNRETIRVAFYARVSGNQQVQAGTIESQVEALKARIGQEGLSVDEEFCFIDDGYTGATLIRPALERLRDLAALGAVDRVYVHSPDRLARKYAWQVFLVDEFARSGVELVFLNRELGKSPEDDLLLQVQGMMAEYERAKIMERSRRGKLHAARQGNLTVLSKAPYGYRYLRGSAGDGQARYEIFLEEARVVQQIFTWIGRDRVSIGEVGRRLKRQGIATRTGKSNWDKSTLWGMLKNPAYVGTAAFGRTRKTGLVTASRPSGRKRAARKYPYARRDVPPDRWILIPVPALVSPELFQAVEAQLEENRQRRRASRSGVRYLLQGLLVCKQCGYSYIGKSTRLKNVLPASERYSYYRCHGTDPGRFGGQRVCSNPQVRCDPLEEAVWKDVCALLSNPQRVEEEFKRRLTGTPPEIEWRRMEQLRTVLGNLKRGMARITDAYEDGLIEKREFETRIRIARDRIKKVEAQIEEQLDEETQRRELTLVIGHLQEFTDRIQNGLEHADWQTRRDILCSLIKQVEVDREEIRVVYRVSPPPFVKVPNHQISPDRWGRKNIAHGASRGSDESRIHDKALPVNGCSKIILFSSALFLFFLFSSCGGEEVGVPGAAPLASCSFFFKRTAVPRIHSISCSSARYPVCRIRAAAHVG
jgi:site-specific DNA recombinase